MKRIILMMLTAVILTVAGCSSNADKNAADGTDGMIDTATSGLGADTTSAASDSLKDSLNR